MIGRCQSRRPPTYNENIDIQRLALGHELRIAGEGNAPCSSGIALCASGRKQMGLTDITMTVSNPADTSRWRELTFLIDSGAIFAVAPRDVLSEIGITPLRVESFSLADCTRIQREVGAAMFSYQG